MNERQALSVIEEMITKAKEDIKDNGFYFLFWGWLVFCAAAINYYLLVFTSFNVHGLPWIILMPLGGIVTVIAGLRERKKIPVVQTYISYMMKYMVWAFSISLIVVCFSMPAGQQWKAFYPTIMVVYAIWLFVSGGLLKFKPLVCGGILNWVLAAIGFIFPSTETHLLLIAAAVFGGYIIPGYLLKQRYHKHVQGA